MSDTWGNSRYPLRYWGISTLMPTTYAYRWYALTLLLNLKDITTGNDPYDVTDSRCSGWNVVKSFLIYVTLEAQYQDGFVVPKKSNALINVINNVKYYVMWNLLLIVTNPQRIITRQFQSALSVFQHLTCNSSFYCFDSLSSASTPDAAGSFFKCKNSKIHCALPAQHLSQFVIRSMIWSHKPCFHQAVRFSSVRYTLERLFLRSHCQKLWMVPIEPLHTVPFFVTPLLRYLAHWPST